MCNERYGLALRKVRPLPRRIPSFLLVEGVSAGPGLVGLQQPVNDEKQIMVCHSGVRGLIWPHQESNVLYNDI